MLDSTRLIDAAALGRFVLLVSTVVVDELQHAPQRVRALLDQLSRATETVSITEETHALHAAYLDERIVNRKSSNDALHIAAATVARADAVVSWNFKDIVRLDRIKRFNDVNLSRGYGTIFIVSPSEVSWDE